MISPHLEHQILGYASLTIGHTVHALQYRAVQCTALQCSVLHCNRSHSKYIVRNPAHSALHPCSRQKVKNILEYYSPAACRTLISGSFDNLECILFMYALNMQTLPGSSLLKTIFLQVMRKEDFLSAESDVNGQKQKFKFLKFINFLVCFVN